MLRPYLSTLCKAFRRLKFDLPVNWTITEGDQNEAAAVAEILKETVGVGPGQSPVNSPGPRLGNVHIEVSEVVVELVRSFWTFYKTLILCKQDWVSWIPPSHLDSCGIGSCSRLRSCCSGLAAGRWWRGSDTRTSSSGPRSPPGRSGAPARTCRSRCRWSATWCRHVSDVWHCCLSL